MSGLTRKHFEYAASLVRATPADHRPWVQRAFVELFAEYGARFEVVRFNEACEVEE